MGSTNQQCCCKGGFVPPSCGNENDCGTFCDPKLKAFAQAKSCGCPCPGNKAYPDCWKLTFAPPTLPYSAGDHLDLDDTTYGIITSIDTLLTVNSCSFYPDALPGGIELGNINIDIYDKDGDTFERSDAIGIRLDAAGFITNVCDAGLGTDTKHIYVQGGWFYITAIGGPAGPVSLIGLSGPPYVSDYSAPLPRCVGGTIVGSLGASIIATPVCQKCDGSPCNDPDGPQTKACGETGTFYITLWDDDLGDYVLHTVPVTGSIGGSDGVVSISISQYCGEIDHGDDPPTKCCGCGRDAQDCIDCATIGGDGASGCVGCWQTQLTIRGPEGGAILCTVTAVTSGSCPTFSLGDASGCPMYGVDSDIPLIGTTSLVWDDCP